MSSTQITEIPFAVKEKLLAFAKKLPEANRSRFLVNTSTEIASFATELAKDHKYTIIYGAIGYLLGYALDQLLTVSVPMVGEFQLTGNLAGALLGLSGAGYGFMRDHEVRRFQNMLKREIQAALQ